MSRLRAKSMRVSSGVARPPMLFSAGHEIVSITENDPIGHDGIPLVATRAASGAMTGASITIRGTGTYDGVVTVDTNNNTTQFQISGVAFSVNTTGGRWD